MKGLARAMPLALACALQGPAAAAVAGHAYEAPLPDGLASDPQMCTYVDCAAVVPGADSFSARKGRPPYVEAYRGTGSARALVGYAFLSTDIVDMPGYSGKPIVTLIGMDKAGRITGTRVLRHSEPILLLGIPETALTGFLAQYLGKSVSDHVEIGHSPSSLRITP